MRWSLCLLLLVAFPARGDSLARDMLDPLREHALHPAELVARMRLTRSDVVADLGAGPGFLTLPLARAAGRVIATDVREDLLARAADAGLRNVETRRVLSNDPGLAPSSVDVALVCQVDQYLPDRAAWVARLAGALKPGGRVVVVNYARFRGPLLAAAQAAGLRVADAWSPSPPFHAVVLVKR